MDSLGIEYSKLAAASIVEQYAFIPDHPKLIAYLSSNFLHGGWLHLIFNIVVPMVGRFRFGGRLGPSLVLALPCRNRAFMNEVEAIMGLALNEKQIPQFVGMEAIETEEKMECLEWIRVLAKQARRCRSR